MKDRYYITGATGLIGKTLTKKLISQGYRPIVQVRNIEKAKLLFGDNVDYVISDLSNDLNTDLYIDYIIHAACPTKSSYFIEHPVETIDTIVNGTKNTLNLASKKEVKAFIYISSMEVYGQTKAEDNLVSETKLGYIDISKIRSCYSEGKRLAENLCHSYFEEYGVPIRIIRLANTFGPGVDINDNRFFMQLAYSAINKNNIVLNTDGSSVSNFCYIDDAIEAIFKVIQNGKNNETYNVANAKETRTIKDIANMVANDICNKKIEVVYNLNNNSKYAPKTELRLDTQKIESLGWKPKTDMKNAYINLIEYITKMKK